ncbi:MAG: DUF192 domain-containing protein [Patescibacteria group bacterium]
MTGSNAKQIAGFFLFLFACLAVVLFAFLYTTRKNITEKLPAVSHQREQGARTVSPGAFNDDAQVRVTIGTADVNAEVAASDAKKHTGLSGHEKLGANEGMLFVFDSLGPYAFWNKDMLFPIDVVWINAGTVVDVYEHMPDFATSPNFTAAPKENATFVLEVTAGFVQEHGITIGDAVSIR